MAAVPQQRGEGAGDGCDRQLPDRHNQGEQHVQGLLQGQEMILEVYGIFKQSWVFLYVMYKGKLHNNVHMCIDISI